VRLRSLLFVPGDSERKFDKARSLAADGLILDLEDAVAPQRKPEARKLLAKMIAPAAGRDWNCWVRINSFDTGLALEDLAATVMPGLDGILMPKANGSEDVVRLGHCLDALEAKTGVAPGHVKILVVATETPTAMFNLGSYIPRHPRLAGLTWGAEDLSSAIGAITSRSPDGAWNFPYQLARAQCLFAASAADVAPIETLYTDYRDSAGLAASCQAARRDGFTGRIAIHPDQVATINRCFTPSDLDVAHARRVVDAFAAQPEAGTIGIDGKMYDIPHLKQAERVLASLQPVRTP
jgi:citrate lyase subunit beta/citryl-CoA lyase